MAVDSRSQLSSSWASCFRFQPSLLLEAMQRRVQRALADLENFAADLLNAFGDGPAVCGLERDGLEDQQVERALNEVRWSAHARTAPGLCET